MTGGGACKLESHAKTQSRAFIQATPTHRLASPRHAQRTSATSKILQASRQLPSCSSQRFHSSSSTPIPAPNTIPAPHHAWARVPKRACDADSLPSTQEATPGGDGACWGGGIHGGRFGRPGHFTKRALGHDQVLARTRVASSDARLLAAKSARETQVPWTRLAGPRRPLPGPSGPRK
jgi:hypothetical protein